MSAGSDRPAAAVVRAERFELVDGQGRVRAVIGTVGGTGTDGGEVVGLELRDEAGEARAWLAVEEGWGAQLCLAERGNQVVLVDLVEASPSAAEPGAAIRLCDADGVPVVEWRVTAAGRFVQRLREPGDPA